VLLAGLLAGALDIAAAIAAWNVRGVPPVRILQSVAGGLLGRETYAGGAATAALGTALHFFIATTAAAVYYGLSRRLGDLARRPLAWGAAYGIAVYAVMNHVVLPLSALPQRPFDPYMAATMVVIHILCVGLPIAWVVSRGGCDTLEV
jgi:hypothetical protein